MIDPSGLKNFVKQAIVQYVEDEMDFEESFREAATSNVFRKEAMTIDEFVDEIATDVQSSIVQNMDFDGLSDKIVRELLDRSLTFEAFPNITSEGDGHRMTGEYSCSKCLRIFGEWKSPAGAARDPNVLSNGRTIIIADDF